MNADDVEAQVARCWCIRIEQLKLDRILNCRECLREICNGDGRQVSNLMFGGSPTNAVTNRCESGHPNGESLCNRTEPLSEGRRWVEPESLKLTHLMPTKENDLYLASIREIRGLGDGLSGRNAWLLRDRRHQASRNV